MPRPIMPLLSTSHLDCTNMKLMCNWIILKSWELRPCCFFSYTREVKIFCIFVPNLETHEDRPKDKPLPQGSQGIQDMLSDCDITLTKFEVRFERKAHLPWPVWTMTTAPLGIMPCSFSQDSRSSSCSTLSKPPSCTLFRAINWCPV